MVDWGSEMLVGNNVNNHVWREHYLVQESRNKMFGLLKIFPQGSGLALQRQRSLANASLRQLDTLMIKKRETGEKPG